MATLQIAEAHCADKKMEATTPLRAVQLKKQYINRHNKIGRLIMTRVLRGRRGAFVLLKAMS